MIRSALPGDAAALAAIYNPYIEKTVITFEETPVSPAVMEERIRRVTARYPWLVCEEDGEVLGYACAGLWRDRASYRYTVEDSIYLREDARGRGRGTALMERLLEALAATDAHVVVAGITIPNPPSVALHERFGFTPAARFHETGFKLGRWLDVGYWEKIIRRGA